MSLKLRTLIDVMWMAHPVLQFAVVAVMYRRKLHLRFRFFFLYLIFQVVTTPVVFFLSTRTEYYSAYFYSYWGTAAVCGLLGFKIIHEIFLDIFKPYHTLKDLGSVLFQWAALVMLLVAGVIAASAGTDVEPLIPAILTVQRCVRVMQCGLIILLVLFSKFLRTSYKQFTFGISAGFGTFAAVELFIAAWVAGGHGYAAVAWFNTIAYNCAIVVWLAYALVKQQPREAPENSLVPQRWDQSFMDLQHPMPADSLIPLFETMVEQAISRVQEDSGTGATSGNASVFEPTLQEKISASLAKPPESPALTNSAAAAGDSSGKR